MGILAFSTAATVFASVPLSIWHGGLRLRSKTHHFKVSKEIRWGIGEGAPKRNDDFLVDGQSILPKDILFYYRRGTALRRGVPEMISTSVTNATAKGYECVTFDRTPVPLSMLWKVLIPRYTVFPLIISVQSLGRQIAHPSTGYLNRTIMSFLRRTLGWEVFLASYSPELNLGQDEPELGLLQLQPRLKVTRLCLPKVGLEGNSGFNLPPNIS